MTYEIESDIDSDFRCGDASITSHSLFYEKKENETEYKIYSSVPNCSSFDFFDSKFDHSSYSKKLCKHSQI